MTTQQTILALFLSAMGGMALMALLPETVSYIKAEWEDRREKKLKELEAEKNAFIHAIAIEVTARLQPELKKMLDRELSSK